jgi:hypothetical protein
MSNLDDLVGVFGPSEGKETMTIEDLGKLPIESLIAHPKFISLSLSKESFVPLLWEITMKCDENKEGYYTFLRNLSPYRLFKFYKVFSPMDFKPTK